MFRFVILMICFFSCGIWAGAVSQHGQLSVTNGKIVDKNGNPPQLRGMSMFWNLWYGDFYNQNVVNTLASTTGNGWGASLVRAAIGNRNVSQVKQMIDWAVTADIYVIIDNHSHCAHNSTAANVSFFGEVAAYVKSKGNPPNVLYEIYNEPVYENCDGNDATDKGTGSVTSWSQIKTYSEEVIKKIREFDSNNLILVGTPFYAQGTEQARQDPITGYSGIAYTLHFYASEPGHAKLKMSLLKAHCFDFPVFITEWGTSEASGDGVVDMNMANSWLSYVEALKLSWANWSVVNKGESSGALETWAGSTGNWNDSELSVSGRYVKKIMKGLNAGGTVSSVDLSAIDIDCKILTDDFTYEGTGGIFSLGEPNNFEHYLDIYNADVLDHSNAFRKMVLAATDPQQVAQASFRVLDVPVPGTYLLSTFAATSAEGAVLRYSVAGGEWQTINLTHSQGLSKVVHTPALIELPADSAAIEFSWLGDMQLDYFRIYALDSADSVDYNLSPVSGLMWEKGSEFHFQNNGRIFHFPSRSFERLDLYAMSGRRIQTVNVKDMLMFSLDANLPNGLYKAVLSQGERKWHLTVAIY